MVKNKFSAVSNIVSSICSSKYFDPGHKKRIDFLKFVEAKGSVKLHIYNEDNQHEFKSYQGTAKPCIDKEKGLVPYKYYFMCENNIEANFITEKLWEPILCEALCFYWGCPNVADHVDPMAYVQLNMDDFEASYNIMNAAIETNLWQERLPYIKKAKQRILDEQGFFPMLEKALKPKTVCFIHSCHLVSAGTEKLDLVLRAAMQIKEVEAIIINNIGLPIDSQKYMALDSRIQVMQSSNDPGLFELPTLRLIHDFSLNSPNTKILYLHTKGISYAKGDPRYENGLDWINYMLHFLCTKSDDCLKLLDTHDAAGCNFSEAPKPHFSGNFWWVNSSYIKRLDTGLLTDKMSAEWWLLSKPDVKKVSLWQSNKNHFMEGYNNKEYISRRLAVICSKNPTNILLNTINNLQKFYPEFDIVIVDSDSTNTSVYEQIPSTIKVEYIKNKHWELGAWYYAYNKYNKYNIYMFIQDTLTPKSRIPNIELIDTNSNIMFSCHYSALLKDGGYYDELKTIYSNTDLSFISEMSPDACITGTAHSSFITSKENAKLILQLQIPYIKKELSKTKIDCWLSERTCGILSDYYKNKRYDMNAYFTKVNGNRDLDDILNKNQVNSQIVTKCENEEYMPSFHILIACGGRPTLKRLLDSLVGQLNKSDAITIVFDGENTRNKSGYLDTWLYNTECNIYTVDQIPNLGKNIGGEPIRTKYQSLLEKKTTYIMHADDDDIYLPGAFDKLRKECKDINTLYIAKFDYDNNRNKTIPQNNTNTIEFCNIGTPCGIIPFQYANSAVWEPKRGGDYQYYNKLQHHVKSVIWLDTIIYRVMSVGDAIVE